METGLITVVVPIYKTEKYLDRCITSIVNQSYENLEIILVDDGSPDNCPRMCDSWAQKDSRIRVIHKENQGSGMARNSGIENAHGEFICFFDSDDYIALETVEKAYTLAIQEKAEIVVFGTASVNRNGEITKQIIPESMEKSYCGNDVQTIFLPDLIDSKHNGVRIHNLCLSACSCLFSMALVRQTGWRFVSEREIISEDSYSIIWLYKYVNNVVILPEALYFYCENESSQTRVFREDRYQKIKQFYPMCLKMADKLNYCQEVQRSISGLFLSFSIAGMKQIAAANVNHRKKKRLLMEIINDEAMQRGLEDAAHRSYGWARRILFWAMRHKWFELCYILLAAQNASKK